MPRPRLLPALALVVALSLAACTTGRGLPDYARGQGQVTSDASHLDSDLIPYQALEREDFKASEPPPQWARVRDKIGAATCGLIVPDEGIQMAVQRAPGGFRTEVRQLEFTAYMDRDCSWWNQESDMPRDYVLQHEQIHFAIFELEARRLNAESERLRARLSQRGDTAGEAVEAATRALDQIMREALARVLERSTRFDSDASMGVHRERQRAWAEKVEAELNGG